MLWNFSIQIHFQGKYKSYKIKSLEGKSRQMTNICDTLIQNVPWNKLIVSFYVIKLGCYEMMGNIEDQRKNTHGIFDKKCT